MPALHERKPRTGKRSYEQLCAVALALDVVGERWTLLLVRELLFGPRRFGELLEALSGIGPNLLSARLKSLGDEGIVRRVSLRGSRHWSARPEDGPASGASGVGYELTEEGRALEPVLLGLARWELGRVPAESADPSIQVRPEWSILAWQARFEPATSSGISEVYQIDSATRSFRLHVHDAALEITAARDPAAAVVLTADPRVLGRLGLGEISLEAAVAAGEVRVQGSPFAVARLARVFGMDSGGGR